MSELKRLIDAMEKGNRFSKHGIIKMFDDVWKENAELSAKIGELESQVAVMRKFISELRETICGTVDFALRTQKSCISHCSHVELCLKCAELLGNNHD